MLVAIVAAAVISASNIMCPVMARTAGGFGRDGEHVRNVEGGIAVEMPIGDLRPHGVIVADFAKLMMELIEIFALREHCHSIARVFDIQS